MPTLSDFLSIERELALVNLAILKQQYAQPLPIQLESNSPWKKNGIKIPKCDYYASTDAVRTSN
jgi:hypothetical protein